jgi:adenylate cyclase, class 2
MPAEIEIKLKVDSLARVRRLIRALRFRRASARRFESNYLFDFPDQRLRRSGRLLRLRVEDGQATVTFKGPPARFRHFKVREEIETPVAGGDEVRRIFESLGLRQTFCYQKFRTTYRPRRQPQSPEHAELTLDETPIGTFVELEGPRRWIDKVAGELGYGRADYITASYSALYFDACRRRGVRPANMVFRGVR